MSTSRIEIPLTLPPPHFDDDATIATARQVVPIKGARRIEGRRKILAVLPLLIASTLCGALGAIAVNYLERRRDTAASVTQQQPTNVATQSKTTPTPVVIAPEGHEKTEVQASVPPKDPEVIAANEPPAKNESTDGREEDVQPKKSAPPVAVKREPAQDAAKLVRKRRVQAADSETPPRRNRRTAGRIEDLFTGPNP